MPLLAGVFGTIAVSAVIQTAPEDWLLPVITQQFFIAVGWIAGTYYSLSYLKKTCIMYDPPSYISPCIVAGIIMMACGLALCSFVYIMAEQLEALIIAVISHGVAYLAYANATRQAFKSMRPDAYPKKKTDDMQNAL
jgi:hypothetical protein